MLDSFILAGGESKRFGEDKLFYRLNGKRILDYVIYNAYTFGRNVFLVVKEKEKFRDINCDGLILDVLEERASIIGLLTALLKGSEKDRIVLSGDMPFVDKELIDILIDNHSLNYTVFSVDGKIYPFPGIYSQCLLGDLYLYIKEGGRSIVNFLSNTRGKIINIENTKKLANINRKEDIYLFRSFQDQRI